MEPIKTDDIDHDLITDFKNGSAKAMEEIIRRYEGPVFNFVLRMCGHVQDAEDVMQETFLSAFRSLPNFREKTKLKNWLFRIASRACIKKRRKKKSAPHQEIPLETLLVQEGPQGKHEIPDGSSDPAGELLRSELRQVIEEGIRSLPPKYRLVFNLRDFNGFDTEETAEILGITPQSVKTRLHRARLYLRDKISDHYQDGGHHA